MDSADCQCYYVTVQARSYLSPCWRDRDPMKCGKTESASDATLSHPERFRVKTGAAVKVILMFHSL